MSGWVTYLSRTTVRQYPCPACGAPPGEHCVGVREKVRESNHRERVEVAEDDLLYGDHRP